jgi:hypothetical protein
MAGAAPQDFRFVQKQFLKNMDALEAGLIKPAFFYGKHYWHLVVFLNNQNRKQSFHQQGVMI